MINKQENKDVTNSKDGATSVSKRRLIKAAALGVVAASAGVSKFLGSKFLDAGVGKRARMKYVNDDLEQEKIMSQKKFVLMTDEEKKQMLNELLR